MEIAITETPPTRRFHVAPHTWNPTRIAEAMRDWADLVGEPPRVLDWCPLERSDPRYRASLWERHYPRWPEASTVTRAFGSWRDALIAAGLPVDRPPLVLALQDRIAAARSMRGEGLSYREIARELGVHPNVVGAYVRARVCDNCASNYVVVGRHCSTCANRREPARPWSAEEVRAAILRWGDVEGRPPTSEQWQPGRAARGRWAREYPRWPSVKDVQRAFGSWNQALRAAGITPVHPIGVTAEQVLAAITDAHAELGHRLTYKTYTAWARANRRPSTRPLVGHFGTFSNARRAAGIGGGEQPSETTHAAQDR